MVWKWKFKDFTWKNLLGQYSLEKCYQDNDHLYLDYY